MIRKSVIFLCAAFLLPMIAFTQDKDVEAVKAVLLAQQAAWNRADLDAFMEGYRQSEELQFIGGKGVTYGWQNTLERYKKTYPDPDAMGQLHFDILEVEKLAKTVISMTGKFTLTRKNDQPSGYFLLLWQKVGGEWKIIADCTSVE